MRGAPDIGCIQSVCEVKPCVGGFKGRLSIQSHGTRFTDVYPAKGDARAALETLRSEVLGPNAAQYLPITE